MTVNDSVIVESQDVQEELPHPQGTEGEEEESGEVEHPIYQIKLEGFVNAPSLEFANLALLTLLTTNDSPFSFYNLIVSQLGNE